MLSADLIVVGAGAAGLMAAIQAARTNPSRKIILIDRRRKIGAKILISGGTRCNVTNRRVLPSDYAGGPAHFVKHVLEGFNPAKTIDFFKEIGVDLVLEPTGKYFPETHSGKTVLEALMKEAQHRGVELVTNIVVSGVKKKKEFELSGRYEDGEGPVSLQASRVVLATGGLSYPETGSDGTGYKIARLLGHTIVPTVPALTPLLTQDVDWRALSGIALPVRLTLFAGGRKKAMSEDSFLFTHFGFSGPAALDISRHWAYMPEGDPPRLEANFVPRLPDGKPLEILRRRVKPGKKLKNILSEEFELPERLAETILKKAGSEDLRKIAHALCHYPLEVSGVYGYKKAEATAGGVDLKEVNVATMESKKTPGLYFAGEILDVDGRIGGFNFQWAWSTGAIAGRAAAKSL